MTAPNRNTLWAEILVDELVEGGVSAVCVSPGSRSTPLTVAAADHDGLTVYSHLDERSSAFFALGRSRRIEEPTALVCTSGTAAANYHPAVMEASESRVPLIALTADRPPELQDSGANQTTDQEKLYGGAVRYYRTLPEPEPTARKLRSLRVTASRAVSEAVGTPSGPVHLNVPFRKPLEPIEVEGDVPEDIDTRAPLGAAGRNGPFLRRRRGRLELSATEVSELAEELTETERGLIVCGPANRPTPERDALAALAEATGFPVLADPLSGHRFGSHTAETAICGGYDSYLDWVEWPDPAVVLRFGASPTSKVLRKYLGDSAERQYLVDPAGEFREAEFTATDHITADPTAVAESLAAAIDGSADTSYRERFVEAERAYWDHVEDACASTWFEGGVLAAVAESLPDPATCFVSNSMPVRDLDRFGRPRTGDISVLGNRGVSGIDGIASSGLGAGAATTDPLVLVLGDLAFYHDMNGLLALTRCDVDATIVLIDNDGGGIFHKLPIEQFEPPFTEQFKTPHGLDFAPTGDLYDFSFEQVGGRDEFQTAFEESIGSQGTQLLSVEFDSEQSHRFREQVHEEVSEIL
ncbi:2-succinyl-5-enolpyruvyl-6-hydroxy-3-cyclohexene-1-carboxylic-acid synthase [Halovenus sp. WSH3]|uniref:2-succinyl-5-enolpyruvyl-6-hydroxy-3-cyclohexene-1-carboxylate synthase n=1 Tax=Halovenus carboxidivorans TaxID=2692199 RepID=A0A6B0T586_9EURY|nr:2-succinyl-5-enolpyruvyl-6-hydroxy-3-cyclohexene-1-carboxylic-acid synthase [Halovenus carboxidivorans]MXR51346.1 2-succinyl-5-enolpyruvyl-6-hydroxy-3-cyclohexene-1-carboxylic-acid synthase [Halovenus carboxidivorans]